MTMDTRAHTAILLTALLGLSGCAGTMGSRDAEHAKPDVYAAGDESPGDIYRSWYLFNRLADSASVEGELKLADLSQRRHDEYRSAYYWYRRAAAQGDGIAAANLWYLSTAQTDSARPEAATPRPQAITSWPRTATRASGSSTRSRPRWP